MFPTIERLNLDSKHSTSTYTDARHQKFIIQHAVSTKYKINMHPIHDKIRPEI